MAGVFKGMQRYENFDGYSIDQGSKLKTLLQITAIRVKTWFEKTKGTNWGSVIYPRWGQFYDPLPHFWWAIGRLLNKIERLVKFQYNSCKKN